MKGDLTILIPTYNKNEEEVIKLLKHLNVQGKAVVSNQVSFDLVKTINDTIIIFNNTKGVSINRNILLNNLTSDYCLFIDDDCVLVDDYEDIVLEVFGSNPDLEVVVFSRYSENEMFPSLAFKNRKVTHFYQLSKAGAPGIAIKRSAISKYCLLFNESLGTPNYFYNGEDSLFLYELIKKKVNIFTSSHKIITLLPTKGESSYFRGYDRHFFESVGGIIFLLHHHFYFLFYVKQSMFYYKKTGINFVFILKCFARGKRKIKDDGVVKA